jgi:hypothetical protein
MTIYSVRNVTNGLFACRANKLSRASGLEKAPSKQPMGRFSGAGDELMVRR